MKNGRPSYKTHDKRFQCARSKAGVRPSMGLAGDCYDNAMCASFFATLECELLDRRRFTTKAEARMAVFEFIGGWYNMTLGLQKPLEFCLASK